MKTPDERRREQIDAIAGSPYAVEVSPVSAWHRLLAHFEVTDQKPLADAIRYGLTEVAAVAREGSQHVEIVHGETFGGRRQEVPIMQVEYPDNVLPWDETQ
jgi:hypothetical protein